MKIQKCLAENINRPYYSDDKKQKSSYVYCTQPSFKAGALPFDGMMNIFGGAMQWIQEQGFLASFLIQDVLGMTAPRVGAAFLRDKEVTGKYNVQEGFEVLGREGLTGPCMMAVAPVMFMLAAKFGKTTTVNSRLIKRFGNSLKQILSKQSFDKNLLNNKSKFKTEFYKANIEQMLKDGMSPALIMSQGLNYRRHETLIKKAYYAKRDEETPEVREVRVIWHTGGSGCGKSYSRMELMARVGKENIYCLSDYENGCFDGYNGQPYLWLEDYKGEFKFGTLLRLFDVYKTDLHCRYSNAKALWNEVHVTSIHHPKAIYEMAMKHVYGVKEDPYQWERRITFIRYHYRSCGQFLYRDFPYNTSLEAMRLECQKRKPLLDSDEIT